MPFTLTPLRHAQSTALASLWGACRVDNDTRRHIDASLVESAFLARREDADHCVIALAGARLGALHARDFRDQNLLALWRGADRGIVRGLIESALISGGTASALTRGKRIGGGEVDMEFVFLPVIGPSGLPDHGLGALNVLEDDGLDDRPVVSHRILEARPAEPSYDAPPTPRLAAVALALIDLIEASSSSVS